MSTVFLAGSSTFGATVAKALDADAHHIVGVSSPAYSGPHKNDPINAENDATLRHDRLRDWATANEVPWTSATRLDPDAIPKGTDVILAAHSHAFIGRLTRAQAGVAIGYHPSLLPLHRGRDAIRWTIRDGDRVAGGTVYHLTDAVDAGPIAAQDYVMVPKGATAKSLWNDLLAPLGVELILGVMEAVEIGHVAYRPQDESLATWEPSFDAPRLHRPELLAITDGNDVGPTLDGEVVRMAR